MGRKHGGLKERIMKNNPQWNVSEQDMPTCFNCGTRGPSACPRVPPVRRWLLSRRRLRVICPPHGWRGATSAPSQLLAVPRHPSLGFHGRRASLSRVAHLTSARNLPPAGHHAKDCPKPKDKKAYARNKRKAKPKLNTAVYVQVV